jgi:hypothetical protein
MTFYTILRKQKLQHNGKLFLGSIRRMPHQMFVMELGYARFNWPVAAETRRI